MHLSSIIRIQGRLLAFVILSMLLLTLPIVPARAPFVFLGVAGYGAQTYLKRPYEGPPGTPAGGDGFLSISDETHPGWWDLLKCLVGIAPGYVMHAAADARTLTLGAGASMGISDFLSVDAEAEAYDTRIVSQGSSTYQVGSQVYLRVSATLSGVLWLDDVTYGGASGWLEVGFYKMDRQPCIIGPEGEVSLILERHARDSHEDVLLSDFLDVPVTIGESIFVQSNLRVYCWGTPYGGSCADFATTARITVEPTPGYEGILITSRAQQALPPVGVPEFEVPTMLLVSVGLIALLTLKRKTIRPKNVCTR